MANIISSEPGVPSSVEIVELSLDSIEVTELQELFQVVKNSARDIDLPAGIANTPYDMVRNDQLVNQIGAYVLENPSLSDRLAWYLVSSMATLYDRFSAMPFYVTVNFADGGFAVYQLEVSFNSQKLPELVQAIDADTERLD